MSLWSLKYMCRCHLCFTLWFILVPLVFLGWRWCKFGRSAFLLQSYYIYYIPLKKNIFILCRQYTTCLQLHPRYWSSPFSRHRDHLQWKGPKLPPLPPRQQTQHHLKLILSPPATVMSNSPRNQELTWYVEKHKTLVLFSFCYFTSVRPSLFIVFR